MIGGSSRDMICAANLRAASSASASNSAWVIVDVVESVEVSDEDWHRDLN